MSEFAISKSKVYVDVYAKFHKDGRVIPKRIVWEDGSVFEIDHVREIRKAASLYAGGVGMRYTCVVHGHEAYLFYENNAKWFVERKCT